MTAAVRSDSEATVALGMIWRHPKPRGVAGRCIGHTDVPVDPRKAKNLAHRIRAWARCHNAPRVVITSALRRSVDVGRWLSAWGWKHQIDAGLNEVDFGEWDGQRWEQIGAAAVDVWCLDFGGHAPGGGESVDALLQRCRQFIGELSPPVTLAVGHAGWISAALWLQGGSVEVLTASRWPRAVGYGERVALNAQPLRCG